MAISSSIMQLFARSPLRPLQEHMRVTHECVEHLIPFFEAAFAGDWDAASQKQQAVCEAEKKADFLKKDLRLHLPKGMFLPVHRSDILELLVLQDKLANRAEDIAGLVTGRRMHFPDALVPKLRRLIERSVEASKQADKAIHELDELLETGFSGSEVELVENMIHELDKTEHETDELQAEIRSELFAMEDQLGAVDVVFLYKVIEWIGDLADRAETVGGQLHLMLAR